MRWDFLAEMNVQNFLVNLDFTDFPWGLLLGRIKTLLSFQTVEIRSCQSTSFWESVCPQNV